MPANENLAAGCKVSLTAAHAQTESLEWILELLIHVSTIAVIGTVLLWNTAMLYKNTYAYYWIWILTSPSSRKDFYMYVCMPYSTYIFCACCIIQ